MLSSQDECSESHWNDYIETKAVSEVAATATAMARFLCHHALKYRSTLTTTLATVVAIAVTTNSNTA